MTLARLARLLVAYGLVLVVVCLAVRWRSTLRDVAPLAQRVVVSRWRDGKRVERAVREPGVASPSLPSDTGDASASVAKGISHEVVVATGPLALDRWSVTFGLVPGRDGLVATLHGKTVWLTADDLLAAEAYDRATTFFDASLGLGTHYAMVLHLLATELGVTPAEVEARASIERVRFQRRDDDLPRRIDASNLDASTVRDGVREAALYLARSLDDQGKFRYLVDAFSGLSLGGYSWPRHAGATYFLAQAANVLDDAVIRFACLRAAARMRDEMLKDCGAHKCVTDETEAEIGSSALAMMAFAEILRTGADASYRPALVELARFLRSQQRPDGEMMHVFDRGKGQPVDIQFLYFTGEAALALSRAHRITGDPEDLRAASRALSRLAGDGWAFFGSRYYFSEEHWTCQAAEDLWERAPDPRALAFCLRWHEYQRRLQHVDGDSPFDADGSFGFGPVVTPRVTPASSRGEAAGAALAVLRRDPAAAARAGVSQDTTALLDDELGRAVAFVLRAQLRPGPRHLFAKPEEVRGAIPGSAVDLQLRIDYVQHAGSMMIRWLELHPEPLAP